MDAFEPLVDVSQHFCTQGSVAGLSLESIQLPEGQGVKGSGRGCLSSMKVERPRPEQIAHLQQHLKTNSN